jgi:uncharacterized membrane protein YidH (DUF202 family)
VLGLVILVLMLMAFGLVLNHINCDTSKDQSECDRNRNFIRFMWGLTLILLVSQAVWIYQAYFTKPSKQLVDTLQAALNQAQSTLGTEASSFGEMMKMLKKM